MTEPTLRENLGNYERTEEKPYVWSINEAGITGDNGSLIQTKALGGTSGLVISSKCKNPEAVMKFVEWSFQWENYTTEAYGPEGEYWKYNPDVENAEENKNIIPIEGGPTYARDFLVSLGLPLEVQTSEYDEEGISSCTTSGFRSIWTISDATLVPGSEGDITGISDRSGR